MASGSSVSSMSLTGTETHVRCAHALLSDGGRGAVTKIAVAWRRLGLGVPRARDAGRKAHKLCYGKAASRLWRAVETEQEFGICPAQAGQMEAHVIAKVGKPRAHLWHRCTAMSAGAAMRGPLTATHARHAGDTAIRRYILHGVGSGCFEVTIDALDLRDLF